MSDQNTIRPSFAALIPFFVFIFFYAGLSIWAQDFYKVPMPTAFAVASASAFLLNRKRSVEEKVNIYTSGMGESNIMLMCMIFILAGAFANMAKVTGAGDAAVVITRALIPPQFLLAGIFAVSSLISLGIGTSCGTIAALTPIAAGLITSTGIRPELMLGAVISGAMFGANLSMIADTAIAATRTQNVAMQEKFYTNLKMVLPAALATLVIYLLTGHSGTPATAPEAVSWRHIVLILPYILVLIPALCGINVLILLFSGGALSCLIGILTGAFDIWGALEACGKGTLGMSETLIVGILAGGLLKLIRWNGGIAFIMSSISRAIRTGRGCEAGVFLLVSVLNLFTANNTVAIVIAGPIARELSERFNCEPRRIASIIDAAACFVQGLLPYGAQILIAVGVADTAGIKVSTPALLVSQYYQWLMLGALILSLIFRRQSRRPQQL